MEISQDPSLRKDPLGVRCVFVHVLSFVDKLNPTADKIHLLDSGLLDN